MEIVISGTVANHSGISSNQLLEYLKDKTNEFDFYQFQPVPGRIYASSNEWKAIGKVSSIVSIVSFIWMAYTELIKPNKESTSNDGIIIRIENLEINNNFWIGNTINSKEELYQKIQKALEQIELDSTDSNEVVDSLRNSERWKKVIR